MKIILADTNKIFWLFRAMLLYNSDFSRSEFILFAKNHIVYVSTYILNELYDIAIRKDLPCNESDIAKFVQLTGFKVYGSTKFPIDLYKEYIFDDKDLQVLKDAVEIEATHILTNNLKDFKIKEIKEDFWIKVISNVDNI
jgi:hypothetical protein